MTKGSKSKAALRSIPTDTHSDITWNQFLEVIKQYGFEIVSQKQFSYQGDDPPTDLHFVIAAHREKKLLLRANSFKLDADSEEKVNDIAVYGTLEDKGKESVIGQTIILLNMGVAYERQDRNSGIFWKVYIDGRDKLLLNLSILENTFNFVNWGNRYRYIELRDVNEFFSKSCDWEETRDKFIDNAPDWVREFILTP